MPKVEYSHNNSGGYWWLTRSHWESLEDAGWEVLWKNWEEVPATEAIREGLALEEAKAEWARIVGMNPEIEGCSCCGRPHIFYEHSA